MAMTARLLVALAAVTAALAGATVAFAVQLDLAGGENVSRAGGTGQVQVLTPETDATVNEVRFVVDPNPPHYVTGVDIVWEPAEPGTYFIGVTIYFIFQGPNPVSAIAPDGFGTTTVTVSTANTPITTRVNFQSPQPPDLIEQIEIIIVQQSP